jgi:hypothetical protein
MTRQMFSSNSNVPDTLFRISACQKVRLQLSPVCFPVFRLTMFHSQVFVYKTIHSGHSHSAFNLRVSYMASAFILYFTCKIYSTLMCERPPLWSSGLEEDEMDGHVA